MRVQSDETAAGESTGQAGQPSPQRAAQLAPLTRHETWLFVNYLLPAAPSLPPGLQAEGGASYLQDDLQVSVEPGQLVTVPWRQPIHEVLGMAQVRQPIHRVVGTRVVAAHLVFHHGVHSQGILPVATRVEGAVAGI